MLWLRPLSDNKTQLNSTLLKGLLAKLTNKGSCPKTQISIHSCGKVCPKIYAMQNAKGPKDCQINKV